MFDAYIPDEKPAVEFHAEPVEIAAPPAGSSLSEIMNFYWREMCIRNGIDPDAPHVVDPSAPRRTFVCQEAPDGSFRIMEYVDTTQQDEEQ